MNKIVVLLVEDQECNRKPLASDLKAYGLQVIEATNGQVALDAVRHRNIKFDVLVTDLMMPEMKGDELICTLQADGHTQPMILWTAQWPVPKLPAADMVISKSMGSIGVIAAIRKCLTNKQP